MTPIPVRGGTGCLSLCDNFPRGPGTLDDEVVIDVRLPPGIGPGPDPCIVALTPGSDP